MKKKFILKNNLGMEVTFSPFGASILDILLIFENGEKRIVTMRPKSLKDFCFSSGYYGKTIGRNAGRLENGKFSIEGSEYQVLEAKPNHGLHGGDRGLSNVLFDYELYSDNQGRGIIFSRQVKRLEDGFPGNLRVFVTYFLHKDEHKLEIRYEAKSDANTICNLTSHTYFNLDGAGEILNHRLHINADKFAEISEHIIPTKIVDVSEVMDFRLDKRIGTHIKSDQLSKAACGYDHPFILNNADLRNPSAILSSTKMDLKLNIYTTYPCLVFYSGNYPTNEEMTLTKTIKKYSALALEPQYLPNAINQCLGQTKTGLLKAGSLYQETIIYEFVTK